VIAALVVAIIGAVMLWFYGSLWTTAFIIILGGDLLVSLLRRKSSGCFYYLYLFLREVGYI